MKNKRGLSEIITSVLLVSIALAAIAVFWVVVQNVIQTTTEKINIEKQTVNLQVESTNLQGNGDLLVKVRRNAGPGNVGGITFIVSGAGGSKAVQKIVGIGELEEKTYLISKNEIAGLESVQSVSVAPIIKTSSGTQVQKDIAAVENREIIIID